MAVLLTTVAGFISLWAVAAWLACALFAGHLASEKNRCGFCWFCWGVLFGPISLIASAGLPTRHASAEDTKDNPNMFSLISQPLPVHILGRHE